VHVYPSKIHVIHDWPAPTTIIQLWSFLVLSNVYRKFTLGLAHIASDLNQVTKGGGRENFMWGLSQHQSFDDLKKLLCSSPMISLPDLQQPFEIETDASNYVADIVLTQHKQPMAYHSETLSYVVYKYPTYDK
jgi:hypothetical protein